MQETRVGFLGREDPLEEEMAPPPHNSSILAWRIPWTEEPGGLQSIGSPRIGHDLATEHTGTCYHAVYPNLTDTTWSDLWPFLQSCVLPSPLPLHSKHSEFLSLPWTHAKFILTSEPEVCMCCSHCLDCFSLKFSQGCLFFTIHICLNLTSSRNTFPEPLSNIAPPSLSITLSCLILHLFTNILLTFLPWNVNLEELPWWLRW